ncbi:hypothetical protein CLAFUW4_05204 [Fulvia fulva]|uniref:Uncharacterized protein n=1 Tax=Passalora fulva TaxID=5499 RepID=A0A9Q8PJ00_PASFU|nr:uncharacterized protein CLAFUR5_11702 [Fulvia fulva]KAK4626919.1 hypothetical protein CLAFUR4_05190 [Fulvia fulva]KAK4628144.1 hypothetical protein CLAFUR0_05196 [Fulvia fulva]UJO23269.1 hypothetical protein CLAFUR5_11702 [Fulvia fulva]WPV13258.1 hypothetical protein CLAFUW4_05204 [Fulvia fulva]WPV28833.1 hypothetical protein CLAFUW7_05200 [Fulvia fulva]
MERIKQLQQRLAARQVLMAQLQAECAEIEADIAEVQQQLGINSGFRFLDLPRELRDIVYEFCLAKGKVFLPQQSHDEYDVRYLDRDSYEKPELQLLTNQVILTANDHQHLLSYGEAYERDSQLSLANVSQLSLADLAHRYLTNVSIALNQSNFRDGIERRKVTMRRFAQQTGDKKARILDDHFAWSEYMYAIIWKDWLDAIFVRPMKHVQIDVSNCYCHQGCCRLAKRFARSFRHIEGPDDGYDNHVFPEDALRVTELLGTKTRTERQKIRRALAHGLHALIVSEKLNSETPLTLRFTNAPVPKDGHVKEFLESHMLHRTVLCSR